MSNDKQSVFVTGGNGLVGSKFLELFTDQYTFQGLDISDKANPIDITNREQILNVFEKSSATHVVHYAAFTNVTAAWEQRGDKNGVAYKVNVDGTKNLVEACKQTNMHLIHISTAYVFDGEKDGLYTEADELSPIEWYGETKALAENHITQSEISWTILRIDQPFRSDEFLKPDIVRRIISGLQSDSLYPQFSDHYFGPTYIDDFAKVVDYFIRTNTTGLFNASSGEKWTDYDFAQLVKKTFELDGTISEGDLDTYLKTLERPYQRNTAMDVSKLKSTLDFELNGISDAIKRITL